MTERAREEESTAAEILEERERFRRSNPAVVKTFDEFVVSYEKFRRLKEKLHEKAEDSASKQGVRLRS